MDNIKNDHIPDIDLEEDLDLEILQEDEEINLITDGSDFKGELFELNNNDEVVNELDNNTQEIKYMLFKYRIPLKNKNIFIYMSSEAPLINLFAETLVNPKNTDYFVFPFAEKVINENLLNKLEFISPILMTVNEIEALEIEENDIFEYLLFQKTLCKEDE